MDENCTNGQNSGLRERVAARLDVLRLVMKQRDIRLAQPVTLVSGAVFQPLPSQYARGFDDCIEPTRKEHRKNTSKILRQLLPFQLSAAMNAAPRPQTEEELQQSVHHWMHVDASSRPIPLLVHQTWKSCTLPARQHEWQLSCAALNPGWRRHLWTDAANRELVHRLFPELLAIYDGYDVNIKRVDAVRLLYLYAFGGVYMDIDFACLRPLVELPLPPGTFIAGYQLRNKRAPHAVANAFMAAPPRHPFVAFLIQQLNASARLPGASVPLTGVLEATGPVFLTRSISAYRAAHGGHANVTIHEMPTIYPFASTEKNLCGRGTKPELATCRTALAGTSAGLVTFWTHNETWKRTEPLSWWARWRGLGCGAGVGLCKLTGPLDGGHVAAGLRRLAAGVLLLATICVAVRWWHLST